MYSIVLNAILLLDIISQYLSNMNTRLNNNSNNNNSNTLHDRLDLSLTVLEIILIGNPFSPDYFY